MKLPRKMPEAGRIDIDFRKHGKHLVIKIIFPRITTVFYLDSAGFVPDSGSTMTAHTAQSITWAPQVTSHCDQEMPTATTTTPNHQDIRAKLKYLTGEVPIYY